MATGNESSKGSSSNKVMDVARPGASDPETGSKPMVVGHKSMATDPSMTNHSNDSIKSGETADDNDESSSKIMLSPSKKLTLQPLSENKSEDSTPEKQSENDNESSSTTENNQTVSSDNISTITAEIIDKEEEKNKISPETTEKDRIEEISEREENLQKLIKSGKYKVAISESRNSSSKTYLITFIVVALFGTILLAVLADLDLIKLGFELPFDIL